MTSREQNIIQTVECFYDGNAVPYSTVIRHTECTPDEITRLVKAGRLKCRLGRSITPGLGTLASPMQRLAVSPEWT